MSATTRSARGGTKVSPLAWATLRCDFSSTVFLVASQPAINAAAAVSAISRVASPCTPLFLAGGHRAASRGHTRAMALIALFGPTGVGKTGVAVGPAGRLGGRGGGPGAVSGGAAP